MVVSEPIRSLVQFKVQNNENGKEVIIDANVFQVCHGRS